MVTCTPQAQVCGLISFVLLVGLAIFGLSRVSYYEYGFEKSLTSSVISTDEVYEPGLHYVGQLKTFATFPKTKQILRLNELSCWSKAQSGEGGDDNDAAGVALLIDMDLLYQLRKDRLEQMFRQYGFDPEAYVKSIATEEVKNNAVLFTADQFLEERQTIESQIFNAVKAKVLETAHVEVVALRLQTVEFPAQFYERKLMAAIQNQLNMIEDYQQESNLVRYNTTVLEAEVYNQASKIQRDADSQSRLIRDKASINATKILEDARRESFYDLVDSLQFTSEAHIARLDYMLKLEQKVGSTKYINFNRLPDAKQIPDSV